MNYEVCLKTNKDEVFSIIGPVPPGELNDIGTFRERGLKDKIPDGKRLLGDAGYTGEPDYILTKNTFDPWEVTDFKNRALSRQENFNQKLKRYGILNEKFRHGVNNHKFAFEAVAAIIIYEMEHGDHLLDPYPAI